MNYIYLLYNSNNRKSFIGYTSSCYTSWRNIKKSLLNNSFVNRELQSDYNRSSNTARFTYTNIDKVEDYRQLPIKANYWIDKYDAINNGYNKQYYEDIFSSLGDKEIEYSTFDNIYNRFMYNICISPTIANNIFNRTNNINYTNRINRVLLWFIMNCNMSKDKISIESIKDSNTFTITLLDDTGTVTYRNYTDFIKDKLIPHVECSKMYTEAIAEKHTIPCYKCLGDSIIEDVKKSKQGKLYILCKDCNTKIFLNDYIILKNHIDKDEIAYEK